MRFALVSWFFVAFGWAETITPEDRAYLLEHLALTREMVVNTTQGLSPAQLTFKPAPHRWSVAQCIDHMARSEDYIVHKMVRERLLKSTEPVHPFDAKLKPPPGPVPFRMGHLEDGLMIRAMTDRSRRAPVTTVTGPPPVEEIAPASRPEDLARAVTYFLEVRARTIDYVRLTQDDLRGHWASTQQVVYFPVRNFQDGYQWILRMSAHVERHLQQIDEVKRDGKFPRR